jgi:cold shock CspA family protein
MEGKVSEIMPNGSAWLLADAELWGVLATAEDLRAAGIRLHPGQRVRFEVWRDSMQRRRAIQVEVVYPEGDFRR